MALTGQMEPTGQTEILAVIMEVLKVLRQVIYKEVGQTMIQMLDRDKIEG